MSSLYKLSDATVLEITNAVNAVISSWTPSPPDSPDASPEHSPRTCSTPCQQLRDEFNTVLIHGISDTLKLDGTVNKTAVIDSLALALLSRLTYEQVCDNHPLFYDEQTCQDNDCTDKQCKKRHFDR